MHLVDCIYKANLLSADIRKSSYSTRKRRQSSTYETNLSAAFSQTSSFKFMGFGKPIFVVIHRICWLFCSTVWLLTYLQFSNTIVKRTKKLLKYICSSDKDKSQLHVFHLPELYSLWLIRKAYLSEVDTIHISRIGYTNFPWKVSFVNCALCTRNGIKYWTTL